MKQKRLIGIFATDISAKVQGNLYKMLHKEAIARGYNLMMFSGTYDSMNLRVTTKVSWETFSLAEDMDFVAFIVHAQAIGDLDLINRIIDMGKRKQIPVFVYDGEATGCERSGGTIPIDPDYKQGFAATVNHLIEHHHCRNIFMLAGMKNNKYSDDRIEMYRKAMEDHGIEYCEEQIGYGDFWESPAIEAVNKFLDSGLPTPEAICCANDSMAITAVKELQKRGYRVPQDVLVTGFDGVEEGKYVYPSISTCEPQMDAVADFIFDVIDGKEKKSEFLIPLAFYPKESCGCDSDSMIESRMEMPKLVESLRVNSWQHHMVTTMQFQLIDSCILEDLREHIRGELDLFNGYDHLYCLRDDIQCNKDCKDSLDKMRIYLNVNFLDDKEYSTFSTKSIAPDFERVIENLDEKDMLFIRLLHSGEKIYGYHIVRGKRYSSNKLRILGELSESITLTIECVLRNNQLMIANQKLSEMYKQMSEMYIRDTMTGLYNRHGYYQCLNLYLQREDLKEDYLHIISIDMDGMKYINDGFGHLEGDHAIKSVANAINECFAQPVISARFGGDEFMVAIFTEDEAEPTNKKISRKLNYYLKNCEMLADKEYEVGVSVGQAVVKLSDMKDIQAVEKIADDSMYKDKRMRKNSRR